ncbi:TetR/AcrR family transcriptional regulator [Pseudoalteromonas sp. P1-7a]|uniref:TetR/AcrR family transcriptional regulator n=1 Tax=Pseudoalteromonas sp. P1-7a TaxID=1723755 RepID=UPI0006D664D2|nr:TetR/AcrR family transcriptional regulator [Pseudoalteromonas sp. P1-7a]KPZ60012.1 HTH-type transcriptional repressor ComR [Pseudoalteromonas sp. P1-7a]
MGKRKQFDEEQVLSNIADYFWKHGYAATKVDKLSVLTGLTKTSIYNAYGNKEALFNKAIDYYVERELTKRFAFLDMKKAMSDNIEILLNQLFLANNNDKLTYGCLLTNSIVELAGDEPTLHEIANKHLDNVRANMYYFFSDYLSNNKLANNTDINKLTDFFMTNMQGLRVQSRIRGADTTLANSIDLLLNYFRSLELN